MPAQSGSMSLFAIYAIFSHENAVVVLVCSWIGLYQPLLDVLICFILSATLSTDGGLSLGWPLGAPPAFGFGGTF